MKNEFIAILNGWDNMKDLKYQGIDKMSIIIEKLKDKIDTMKQFQQYQKKRNQN